MESEDRNQQIENTIKAYLDPKILAADVMACDSFLKNWLKDESDRAGLDHYVKTRQDMISVGIIELASAKTEKVYQFSGSEVQMSPDNPRDYWYYEFMESPKNANAELYYDTLSGILHIFYNVKIRDDNGQPIGVLGISFPYRELIELLSCHAEKGNEAYLTDQQGKITVHPDQTRIGSVAIYDTYGLLQEAETEISDRSGQESEKQISLYVSALEGIDSILVIEQDKNELRKKMFGFIVSVVLFFIASIIIFYFILSRFQHYWSRHSRDYKDDSGV